MKIYLCLYNYTQFLIIWMILKISPTYSETIAKPEEKADFLVELENLEDEILRTDQSLHNMDNLAFLTKRSCPLKIGIHSCWNVNNRCYCLVTEKKTWWGSINFCQQYGMELVSFETKEEETSLTKHLESYMKYKNLVSLYLYTSGNRLNGNQTVNWMWVTGVILNWQPNWMNGEPTSKSHEFYEECLCIKVSKPTLSYVVEYNDMDCDYHTNDFICELSSPY